MCCLQIFWYSYNASKISLFPFSAFISIAGQICPTTARGTEIERKKKMDKIRKKCSNKLKSIIFGSRNASCVVRQTGNMLDKLYLAYETRIRSAASPAADVNWCADILFMQRRALSAHGINQTKPERDRDKKKMRNGFHFKCESLCVEFA